MAGTVLLVLAGGWVVRDLVAGGSTGVALDPSSAFNDADEPAVRDDAPVGCGTVHGCVDGCAAPFALARPVLWCRGHGGAPVAPAVSGSSVVTVHPDAVVAVDRTTGVERWRAAVAAVPPGPPVVTDPLVGREGGALVLVGDAADDVLVAYDLADGREVWRGPARTGGTPAVAGDTIVVGGRDGYLTGLDVLTGERRWQRGSAQPASRAPAVADGLVFVSGPGTVLGVDLETGQARVEFPLGHGGTGRGFGPAVVAGTGIAVSGDGEVVGFDTATGARRWSRQLAQAPVVAPALGEGRLHLLTADDTIESLDLADGSTVASATVAATIGGQRTLSLARSTLVLTTLTEVRLLDPDTLTTREAVDLGRALVGSPVVAGGTLYVTTRSALYAIGDG